MHGLKLGELSSPLAFNKGGEKLPFGQIGDQKFDPLPADFGLSSVMVLDQYGAGSQFVEFSCILQQRLAAYVVGVEYLGRADYTGVPFADFINLSLPASSQEFHDMIIGSQSASLGKIETEVIAAHVKIVLCLKMVNFNI